MRTTIEVFGITLKNKEGYLDFSDDPDLFNLLSSDTEGLVSHIDCNSTGDIPSLHRTVRVPSQEINAEGDVIKYHHKNTGERYICGIIETGAYGKEYDIADKDDPRNPTYTVGKDQAIIKPFFYFLKIPRKGTKALLILERTDNEGIYPLMNLLLTTFLNDRLGADRLHKVEKSNIILQAYLDDMLSSRYKSITMTANSLPSDASDMYFGGLSTEDFTMELTFKFKNRIGEDKEAMVRNAINRGDVLFDIPEISDIFDTENAKVVASSGTGKNAKNRTYYFGDRHNKIKPYYDLIVKSNEKNFSDYSDIKEVVKEFIKANPEFKVYD